MINMTPEDQDSLWEAIHAYTDAMVELETIDDDRMRAQVAASFDAALQTLILMIGEN